MLECNISRMKVSNLILSGRLNTDRILLEVTENPMTSILIMGPIQYQQILTGFHRFLSDSNQIQGILIGVRVTGFFDLSIYIEALERFTMYKVMFSCLFLI